MTRGWHYTLRENTRQITLEPNWTERERQWKLEKIPRSMNVSISNNYRIEIRAILSNKKNKCEISAKSSEIECDCGIHAAAKDKLLS